MLYSTGGISGSESLYVNKILISSVLRCLAPLSKLTNKLLRDRFKNIADIVSSFDEVRTYSN